MREFTRYEIGFIIRGLRIMQFVLGDIGSVKCDELAQYFESLYHISGPKWKDEPNE